MVSSHGYELIRHFTVCHLVFPHAFEFIADTCLASQGWTNVYCSTTQIRTKLIRSTLSSRTNTLSWTPRFQSHLYLMEFIQNIRIHHIPMEFNITKKVIKIYIDIIQSDQNIHPGCMQNPSHLSFKQKRRRRKHIMWPSCWCWCGCMCSSKHRAWATGQLR